MTMPAVGRWEIDPRHTSIIFTVRHLMVARVRGRFDVLSGEFDVRDPVEDSRLSVVIEAASINTGVAKRDGHLRSPDFLEAERFPTLEYRAARVRPGDQGRWLVVGELTMHGVTRGVVLDVEYLGSHADHGVPVCAFVAKTAFEREPYGLTYNRALEAGGVAIGSHIDVELTVEAMPAGSKIHRQH